MSGLKQKAVHFGGTKQGNLQTLVGILSLKQLEYD